MILKLVREWFEINIGNEPDFSDVNYENRGGQKTTPLPTAVRPPPPPCPPMKDKHERFIRIIEISE